MDIYSGLLGGPTSNAVAVTLAMCSTAGYYVFVIPKLEENKRLRQKNQEQQTIINEFVTGSDLQEKLNSMKLELIAVVTKSDNEGQFDELEASVKQLLNTLHASLDASTDHRSQEHGELARKLEQILASVNQESKESLSKLEAMVRSLDLILDLTSDVKDKQSTLSGVLLGMGGLHQTKRIK